MGQAGAAATGVLNRSIVLVGLMGAGKSSVGRRLATTLGVPFLDSDTEIERAAGMEIREIFARYGEPEFRSAERRVIGRLLDSGPAVIATGGGAFMNADTRAAVASRATSVWLDASLDVLWDRVRDKPTRPLLQQENPKAVLAALLAARRPVYALADARVESRGGIPHDVMVRAVLAAIRDHDRTNPGRPATLAEGDANVV